MALASLFLAVTAVLGLVRPAHADEGGTATVVAVIMRGAPQIQSLTIETIDDGVRLDYEVVADRRLETGWWVLASVDGDVAGARTLASPGAGGTGSVRLPASRYIALTFLG
jgi:hypothetical protein